MNKSIIVKNSATDNCSSLGSRGLCSEHDDIKICWKQGCKRDLELRDRDETETFGFQSETRSRPRPTKISRDRDETETFDKRVSRPSRDRDAESEIETFFETFHCTLSYSLFTTDSSI